MKFFIDFFKNYPTSTGLLCLVIISHLAESDGAQTSILSMPKEFLGVFFFYVMGMSIYMLFILPKIEEQKREKITWSVNIASVVVLAVFMLLTSHL